MKEKIAMLPIAVLFSIFSCFYQNISAQILEQDSLALVALYDSTDGENWINSTNWLTEHVSSWFGISVSGNRVTKVHLNYNQLKGPIPIEIGNLTNLTSLILRGNQLSGSIPNEITNLANLTELILSTNQLSGNIPIDIGDLTNLTVLQLNQNQFFGPIPTEIFNLKNLIGLNLHLNQLSGIIPTEIGNLTNLTVLNLFHNQLFGTIPKEIYNLTKLTDLILSSNQLTGSISPDIGKLVNLKTLRMSSNMLTDSIPTEIGNLENLETLNLRFNQLSGTIPINLYSLTSLEVINLSRNQLTGTIPPQVGNLIHLVEFSVPENQMHGDIPDELGNLDKLKFLWLNGNNFVGNVPDGIGNMMDLKTLRLDDNALTNLVDLSADTSLTDVQIQDNRFTFEDIEPNIGIHGIIYAPQDSVGSAQDTSVAVGTSLSLSVTVEGSANLYQWQKNGEDILGADNNVYNIDSVTFSDSGRYICRISNTIVTELTLFSRPKIVSVEGAGSVSDQSTQIPKEFRLYQNHPNPFNPSTVISWQLAVGSNVELSIYNILGQKIETLLNKSMPAGYHKAELNGQNLSSGVYLYRIEAGEWQDVKKMVLLK